MHKNFHPMYRAIQNGSNLFFSTRGFVLRAAAALFFLKPYFLIKAESERKPQSMKHKT